MEALWKLEDKWNLSTQKAIAIFTCASFLLIGACFAAATWRRRRRRVHQEAPPPPRRSVEVLLGSVGWSRPRIEWEEIRRPVLVKREGESHHDSAAAVWQRPILMGGKCELPRFSGLILYDQRGTPLHQGIMCKQETMPTPTTLRDLL